MSASFAALLMITLAFLAALHLYWAFGGFWPATNETELIGLVIGKTPDMRMPSPMQCATVSLLLTGGIVMLALRQGIIAAPIPEWMTTIGHGAMTLGFFGRGCITYFTSMTRYAEDTPFYALDRRYYAPFCYSMSALLIAEAIS
jgi:Protein of unknown function (DUF3995)